MILSGIVAEIVVLDPSATVGMTFDESDEGSVVQISVSVPELVSLHVPLSVPEPVSLQLPVSILQVLVSHVPVSDQLQLPIRVQLLSMLQVFSGVHHSWIPDQVEDDEPEEDDGSEVQLQLSLPEPVSSSGNGGFGSVMVQLSVVVQTQDPSTTVGMTPEEVSLQLPVSHVPVSVLPEPLSVHVQLSVQVQVVHVQLSVQVVHVQLSVQVSLQLPVSLSLPQVVSLVSKAIFFSFSTTSTNLFK